MTGSIDAAFRKFDAQLALAREVRREWLHRMVPLEKLLQVVTDSLPQADAVAADDRERWCREVPRICAIEALMADGQAVPDDDESWREWDTSMPVNAPVRAWVARRALWHTRRLGGIGGSESGPLVAAAAGNRDWFATPTGIAAGKLMKRLPEPPDHHRLRGARAEEFIREQAAREHGWRHCPELLAAMTGGRVAEAPWITSSPDDIVTWTGGTGGGRRHLVIDYKSPSTEPMAELRQQGIPDRYAAQLHHYLDVARNCIDTPIDNMMLCAWDSERWETLLIDCPENPELSEAIRQSCAVFWEQVMDGEIPRPQVAEPASVGEDVKELALRAFALSATEKAAAAARKRLLQEIGQRQANAAGGSCPIGPAVMSSRTRWDSERLEKMLEAVPDLDPERFRKAGGALDDAATLAALARAAERARAITDSLAGGDAEVARQAEELAGYVEALAVRPPRRAVIDGPRAAKALEAAGEDVAGCRQTTWQVSASRVSDPAISGSLEEVELTARAGVDAVSEELEEALDMRRDHPRTAAAAGIPAHAM